MCVLRRLMNMMSWENLCLRGLFVCLRLLVRKPAMVKILVEVMQTKVRSDGILAGHVGATTPAAVVMDDYAENKCETVL